MGGEEHVAGDTAGRSQRPVRRTGRTTWAAAGLTATILLASGLAHAVERMAAAATAGAQVNSQAGRHPDLVGPDADGSRIRANGRAAAAALGYAVQRVVGGGQSDFAGREWSGGGVRRQVYAQLVWTPDRGDASVLRLLLRPAPAEATRATCAGLTACTVIREDAGVVRTWTDQDPTATDPAAGSTTRYAELRRPDGVWVRLESSNATETRLLPGDPVLMTDAQLGRIVTEPWWGLRLSDAFFNDGGRLWSYVDLGRAEATYPSA